VRFHAANGAEEIPYLDPVFFMSTPSSRRSSVPLGMGYKIDQHLRDMEDIGCLAEDGSTALSSQEKWEEVRNMPMVPGEVFVSSSGRSVD